MYEADYQSKRWFAEVLESSYSAGMIEPRAAYIVSRAPRRLVGVPKRAGRQQSAAEAGFPGCKAVPRTAAQMTDGKGPHFEYWDAEGGVAWTVREGQSIVHEYPAHNLPALLERVAAARGAPILCGGAMTFYERGASGEHVRAMEADQTLYLDVARARALRSPAVVLGADAPPDVVVEVDHTTDVRRRKLREYQRWRFPEVWVEVPEPWHGHRSRRRPGLTIHVLETQHPAQERSAPRASPPARYHEVPASRAFPGWRAEEIHLALNEQERSAGTWAALDRVGRALGEQEGKQEGSRTAVDRRLQGMVLEERLETARQILHQRGIASGILAEATTAYGASLRLGAYTPAQLVAAALACRSEAEFLATLAASRTQRP